MYAARLLARRWPLYVLTCAVAAALEIAFGTFVHVPLAQFYASLIATPLITCVVTVFVAADARGVPEKTTARWTRVIERAWAVVIVDAGISLLTIGGLQAIEPGSGDPAGALSGIFILIFSAMLVYAEPFICAEDDVRALTLVPFSILRSLMLAWVNISRIFALFAVMLCTLILSNFLEQAAAGLRVPLLWIDSSYGAIAAVLLSALFTVAYLDTVSQEQRSTR